MGSFPETCNDISHNCNVFSQQQKVQMISCGTQVDMDLVHSCFITIICILSCLLAVSRT